MAIFFLTLISFGCNPELFSTEQQVTFILPDSPSPTLLYWEVQITTPFCTHTFTTSEQFNFTMQKNQPCSVLATPVTALKNGSPTAFYKPAGTIYPYTFLPADNTQKLTWEEGFCASVMNKLILNGTQNRIKPEQINSYLLSYNWAKMIETVFSKTEESFLEIQTNPLKPFYNPWLIDETRLMENLANLSFSSTYLDTSYLFTANSQSFPDQAESSYVPQNLVYKQNGYLTLRKNQQELLLCGNEYGACVCGSSAKNMSLQLIYMPIIKEAL